MAVILLGMFNRIKRLFGSDSPTPPWEIVQCETKTLESSAGPKFAIFLAANLHDAEAIDGLVEALIERFKVHRMASPPETSMLLVTIVGPGQAAEIVSQWRSRVAGDPIASVWMARMEKADLGVGPVATAAAASFHSLLVEGGG